MRKYSKFKITDGFTPLEVNEIKQKNRTNKPLTGFTFIEVMVAVFILAVGIMAVLAIFPLGIQIVSSSKMATIAVYLGEEKIEEIISTPYEEIYSESEPTLASPFSAYSRETEVSCFDPNGPGSLPDCPDDTEIKKIKVIVSWGAATKKIELSTLITKR